MRIAISTYEFLHLPGARDLLRMIIRGLKVNQSHELYLLVEDESSGQIPNWSNSAIGRMQAHFSVPQIVQRAMRGFERRLRTRVPVLSSVRAARVSVLREQVARMLGDDIVNDLTILPYHHVPEGVDAACVRHRIDAVIPTTFALQTPFVAYLYDCQHKYFPENFSANDCALRDRLFKRLLDRSAALIVNSRHARHDLIKFFDADEAKVIALPFTPQVSRDVLEARADLLGKYKLPARFFLISNQFWVHKSLETALEALRLLLDEGLDDCHIVFTGEMRDTRFPEYVSGLMKLVGDLKLDEHTTFLGYIPKRDQLEIMKHCVAVVQTTLFEGGPGGGSVFDAVALGVRAVVSAIPINHELPAGRELVLFQPKNSRDLADKMRRFWEEGYRRPGNAELMERTQRLLNVYSDCLYGAIDKAVTAARQAQQARSAVKISVVTVVKNAEAELAKTIDSVLEQGYPHLEYIVVDGGSQDRTADIIAGYGDRLRCICEPDEGIYDAMNKGVEASTGDILYFLNAGDVLADRHVFTDIVSVISDPAYQEYGLFYGNVQFIKPDGTPGRYLEYNPFPFYYYADNCQCHQVCFYRREMFERYGLYDTSFKIYGDQEFNARLVVKHQVPSFYIGRLIVRYTEGGFSEAMMASGANAAEKRRIQKRFFGDTPDWFFDRLKAGR